MKVEDIKRVAILGSGRMGYQIAQIFSQIGKYEVNFYGRNPERVAGSIESMKKDLKKYFVEKGKMTQEEMDEIMGRIKGVSDISEAVKNADFILECVLEEMQLKKDIFKQIDAAAPANSILATNTSNLNITEISKVTGRPEKVIGVHFLPPLTIVKITEVVKGSFTTDETVEVVREMLKKLGKDSITCQDFSFGFVANRAYSAMVNEAVQMLWERVATPEDIDKVLKMGYGLLAGPLEIFDREGIWPILATSEADKVREVGPEKGQLHPMIRMMLRAGYTGGKGNKGIYDFYKEVWNK